MKKETTSKNENVEIKDQKIIIDRFPGANIVDTSGTFEKCHVFMLEVANMLRNISYNANNPIIEPIPHAHIFRTHDSNGKYLTACNSVGGHYHDVKISTQDGEWVIECSPAISGKSSSELIKSDMHTHVVRYKHTETVQTRILSAEVMNMVSNFLKEPK